MAPVHRAAVAAPAPAPIPFAAAAHAAVEQWEGGEEGVLCFRLPAATAALHLLLLGWWAAGGLML